MKKTIEFNSDDIDVTLTIEGDDDEVQQLYDEIERDSVTGISMTVLREVL